METDITSVVIGIAALACFFVPIFYLEVYKKRTTKKFEKKFNDLALKSNMALSKHNTWHNSYAIGLDYKKGRILYLNSKNGQDVIHQIDLSEVVKCRIFRENDFNLTTNTGIVFAYRNASKPELKLEFYLSENGYTLGDEIILAEKWAGLINPRLRTAKKRS